MSALTAVTTNSLNTEQPHEYSKDTNVKLAFELLIRSLVTPLSGTKKQNKWHQYSEGMWFRAKIRVAASEARYNVKTA